mmetsp:Transcript_61793/g.170034  ORF Transcript_61793/g.170034 Transcript_61793/m.170034 type:complete len:257 (+) Transcript_61793:34-804(+)
MYVYRCVAKVINARTSFCTGDHQPLQPHNFGHLQAAAAPPLQPHCSPGNTSPVVTGARGAFQRKKCDMRGELYLLEYAQQPPRNGRLATQRRAKGGLPRRYPPISVRPRAQRAHPPSSPQRRCPLLADAWDKDALELHHPLEPVAHVGHHEQARDLHLHPELPGVAPREPAVLGRADAPTLVEVGAVAVVRDDHADRARLLGREHLVDQWHHAAIDQRNAPDQLFHVQQARAGDVVRHHHHEVAAHAVLGRAVYRT